jgi:hypothetical protein
MASTHEDIMAVFNDDINEKSRLVEAKFGKAPFYDNFEGFSIKGIYDYAGIEDIKCSEFTPRRKNAPKISQKP